MHQHREGEREKVFHEEWSPSSLSPVDVAQAVWSLSGREQTHHSSASPHTQPAAHVTAPHQRPSHTLATATQSVSQPACLPACQPPYRLLLLLVMPSVASAS